MLHDLRIYRRWLPHWRLDGSTYFVTWRLARDTPDLTPDERSLVVSALQHFDSSRYSLIAFVVMNDHVHAIVRPKGKHRLQDILHSWKSYTAREMQRHHCRIGSVWQAESFDRIIRDEDELREKIRYIIDNPRKRWPEVTEYAWVGFGKGVEEVG